MKFRPLHDRVLVRGIEQDEKTTGGIIIPDTAKEKPMEGEVIAVGAEGDNRLHGYRGDTGEELTKVTGETMQGLRHFVTVLAVDGYLYVAADGRIFAFAF